MDETTAESLRKLGELTLRFAQVNRVTRFPDGVTPESDTDHTVMLGLIACAYAAKDAKHLDIGKIAQFALVHDLIEAYAGDTDTFGMHADPKKKHDKEEREAAALARLEKECGTTLPWITETIHEYESLSSPEARFVKSMDKTLPKVTHSFNDLVCLPNQEAFNAHCDYQLETLKETYGKDQPAALAFYEYMVRKINSIFAQRVPEKVS